MSNAPIILGPSWRDSGWDTQGLVTNPSAGDVIADTDELIAGVYTFYGTLQLAGYANIWVAIEHRNAANGANLATQSFWLGTPVGNTHVIIPQYEIAVNERIRYEVLANLTGTIQASIRWIRHY